MRKTGCKFPKASYMHTCTNTQTFPFVPHSCTHTPPLHNITLILHSLLTLTIAPSPSYLHHHINPHTLTFTLTASLPPSHSHPHILTPSLPPSLSSSLPPSLTPSQPPTLPPTHSHSLPPSPSQPNMLDLYDWEHKDKLLIGQEIDLSKSLPKDSPFLKTLAEQLTLMEFAVYAAVQRRYALI